MQKQTFLVRVVAKHFVAGIEFAVKSTESGKVVLHAPTGKMAPILRKWKIKSLKQLRYIAKMNHRRLEIVDGR